MFAVYIYYVTLSIKHFKNTEVDQSAVQKNKTHTV